MEMRHILRLWLPDAFFKNRCHFLDSGRCRLCCNFVSAYLNGMG